MTISIVQLDLEFLMAMDGPELLWNASNWIYVTLMVSGGCLGGDLGGRGFLSGCVGCRCCRHGV